MGTYYVGEMRIFGGNFAIIDWAICAGQQMAISQNQVLYTLIGTTYGGDGVNTFNLPNMQGNLAVGQGQGLGLQNWVMGEIQGNTSITLNQSQVPAHTHTATFASNVQFAYELPGPGSTLYPGRLQKGSNYTPNATNAAMHPATITTQGGSQPHDNTMPQLVMNYIISLFGIFPSQN